MTTDDIQALTDDQVEALRVLVMQDQDRRRLLAAAVQTVTSTTTAYLGAGGTVDTLVAAVQAAPAPADATASTPETPGA